MANFLGQVLNKVNEGISGLPHELTTGYAQKLWRAAILLHRVTHRPHAKVDKKDPAKGHNTIKNKEVYENLIKANSNTKASTLPVARKPEGNNIVTQVRVSKKKDTPKDTKPTSNQIILYNLTSKPYERIIIQNRPNSIEYKGETSWATIKSMGRNTPMYHYTGAEDTVQFNISWYCDDPEHPDEVVNKCRFLEAWTKANGYQASPPVIRIQWGDSDIFKDQTYILISATYTLNNFNDNIGNLDKDFKKIKDKDPKNGKLYPSTATQELVFKRVSAYNLSYEDILPKDKMEYTKGINK